MIETSHTRQVCSTKTLAFGLLISALALCLALPAVSYGQASAGTGSFSGVLTDPSGAVIPDAEVVVRNVDTNVARTVKSNEVGRYEVVALQPGQYEIRAAKSGFASLVRTGMTLSVGARAVVNLAMTVSAAAQTVTVNADVAAVDPEKTEVSTVVNMNDMRNLPLNGRRWDAFVMNTPGATNDSAYGLITFRGISGLYNNNMIDGMDNNQAFFSEAKGRTRLQYGISSEAVQEFQVGTSNFSAQYGRSAGGVINAVTKSGANQMHGTFFYFIRDDSMNATNSIAGPTLKGLGLAAKPKDRRQQFGPSVGGALKKDKLFYFLSYDQQKRTFPATIVPYSSTFLTGTGTAPGYANAVSFYKGLTGLQDRQGNQQIGLSKIDWNLSPRNQISSTVNILRWLSPNGQQTAPTHGYDASANGDDAVDAETVITRWNATITPTFLSEVRFQWGRDFEYVSTSGPGPYVGVTNGLNFGRYFGNPRTAYPDERRWQISQNLNWLRGRHSVKFGFDFTRVHDKMINLYQGYGQYSYSNLNNIALDCPTLAMPLPLKGCVASTGFGGVDGKHYSNYYQAFDALGLDGKTEFNTIDYAFYIEDTYKPWSNFTVNAGLRYDLETMPSLTGNPALPSTSRINTDKNNIGPRIGLSWDPFKTQKTVIRAGAGMYYGRTQNSTMANLITNNGVRFLSYNFTPTTAGSPIFPNVLASTPSGSTLPSDVLYASSDFANPLIYQMEFSVEQEVFKNFTLTATYLGSRGQRLPLFRDTNLNPVGSATYTICADLQVGSSTACSNVAKVVSAPFYSGARPITSFGAMTVVDSVVNSWYNGFVLQAKQRFSHGFQLQSSLTISKAQDNGQSSQTFSTSNQSVSPFNLRQDYALSDFDQRKRFTLSGSWQLPLGGITSRPLHAVLNGFQLSGVLALFDGRPYSGSISGSPTPRGTLSGIVGASAGSTSRVPFVGRNTFTSPGGATLDARLAREFRISERMRFQLMLEGFNILNRINITGINTTQYNISTTTLFPRTDWQTVSATGTNLVRERNYQIGARFSF
jgi:TonB-dependent Receptor Plug Domain.